MKPRRRPAGTWTAAPPRHAAAHSGRWGQDPLGRSRLTLLHFVLGGLVLMSAGQIHQVIPFLGVLRPGILLVLLSLAAAALYPNALRLDNLIRAWPGIAVLCLAAIWLASSFLGLSLTASASFMLQSLLPLLIGFILTLACLRNVNDIIFIVAAYVASMLIVVLASVFLADTTVFGDYSRRGGVGMYDGNDIGVLYMVGIPLALTLARSSALRLRLLGWAGVLGMPLSLVLTASRGGFLGLLSGGLALLVLTPGVSVTRKATFVLVAAGSMVFLAPAGYWGQMATMLNPQEDYNVTSDTGRLQLWRNGMGYVQEFPILGIGPDNFVRAGWELSVAGRTRLSGVPLRDQAPHNTFLQVWAELGTIGLLMWLGILVGGVVSCMKLRQQIPRWWLSNGGERQRLLYLLAAHLPASFIGFAVTTFFVSHAYTPPLYILFAILGGTLIVGRKAVLEGTMATRSTVEADGSTAGGSSTTYPMEPSSRPLGGGIPLPRALRLRPR